MTEQESQSKEDKQSLSEWKETAETVAAFATSQGGVVRIGINPAGKRIGVQIGKGTMEDLVNKIKTNTAPPQYPSIAVDETKDCSVIIVRVAESPVKPVWAFGRPIKRVGRTNQRLSREEAQRMMEMTTGRTWDALVCDRFSIAEFDKEMAREYIGRTGMKFSTSVDDLLKNIRMYSDAGFCNAAVLVFGKCPQDFFPESQVKCARFKGTDSIDFIDEKNFEGNILWQLESVMDFVVRNTRQAIRITGKPAHDVIPEYPEEAVRETVINALCHRNYAEVSAIQVRIYDDRLEVWNPGLLPHDMTIQKLYRQHASRPRNPTIAHALYRARYIEQWGTGTLRIIGACKEHNIKAEFQTDMGVFVVRLKKLEEPTALVPPLKPLNARQKKALEYIKQHGRITRADYEKLTTVSYRTAVREINDLISRRYIQRCGAGRHYWYEVISVKG